MKKFYENVGTIIAVIALLGLLAGAFYINRELANSERQLQVLTDEIGKLQNGYAAVDTLSARSAAAIGDLAGKVAKLEKKR